MSAPPVAGVPMSAGGLVAAYSARSVRAVDVVATALARAEEVRDRLGAFLELDHRRALADAADRDAALRSGAGPVGPLHGVPVAVKDVIDVADLRITGGSRHFAGRRAERDAACVRALRTAGAIVIGTTVTHELAYGPTGDRSASGPVRHPDDPTRMTGGSSAGSAVAVATGTVPIALGTDTGGSVRVPSALCGVVGLKPTLGLVPTAGVMPLARSLDHVGVHAATTADVELALGVLSPTRLPVGRRPTRVGWWGTPFSTGSDDAVVTAVRRYAEQRFGALCELELPADAVAALLDDYAALQGGEAYAEHAERVERAPELFDPEVLERLRAAARVPAWTYVRATSRRARLRRVVEALFDRVDVVVSPTTPITAPHLDQRVIELGGTEHAVRDLLLSSTSPLNVLGLPAVSVPVPVPGLPVGAQLVGRGHGELSLLT